MDCPYQRYKANVSPFAARGGQGLRWTVGEVERVSCTTRDLGASARRGVINLVICTRTGYIDIKIMVKKKERFVSLLQHVGEAAANIWVMLCSRRVYVDWSYHRHKNLWRYLKRDRHYINTSPKNIIATDMHTKANKKHLNTVRAHSLLANAKPSRASQDLRMVE